MPCCPLFRHLRSLTHDNSFCASENRHLLSYCIPIFFTPHILFFLLQNNEALCLSSLDVRPAFGNIFHYHVFFCSSAILSVLSFPSSFEPLKSFSPPLFVLNPRLCGIAVVPVAAVPYFPAYFMKEGTLYIVRSPTWMKMSQTLSVGVYVPFPNFCSFPFCFGHVCVVPSFPLLVMLLTGSTRFCFLSWTTLLSWGHSQREPQGLNFD